MARLSLALLSVFLFTLAFDTPLRKPMEPDMTHSALYRWLHKPVEASRVLDDMENLSTWHSYATAGEEVVDARKDFKLRETDRPIASIELSRAEVHEGKNSLLMRSPTRTPGPGPSSGRGWGRAGVRRYFDGEDWSVYNRISIWIYPDLPGFYTTALDMRLYNEGAIKLPAPFGQEGETSWVLQNHCWNHIVWEIGNVSRDKVTGFEMSYGLSGNMPEESDSVRFYFDELNLEKVTPDKTEGWDVWPGRISYSHAGYQTGAEKSAIASGLQSTDFFLVDTESGDTVFRQAVQQVHSSLGNFQQMDFSAFRRPGNYQLRAGNLQTQAFPIAADVWESSIWKALNFFYMERCGADVPGVHSVCHRDWTVEHDHKRIVINGGWHDAGDLTQGMENSSEIAYALFSLAEKLQGRKDKQALFQRVLEEGLWGLDWILKTRFGDGYRDAGSINSRRTNNIIGDDDDIVAEARNNPMTNFQAAAVEAIAYRVLKDINPRLAAYALKTAESDWKFAADSLPKVHPSAEIWRGTFDSENSQQELAAQAALCSVDLWRATQEKKYEQLAVAMVRKITDAQQRERTKWNIPLEGFFYTSSRKDRIVHYVHRGRQQGPALALQAVCEVFPGNPDWMRWYSSLALYAEYLKKIARFNEPYGVMPASVYSDTEYLHVPASRQASFREQVLQGIPLGKGHYLRRFPVWLDYRGHFGTILPQAQVLAAAALLRNDSAAASLATRQLEWIIGRNPFSQSAMYGEGYDFPPLYSPSSGQMTGGLPVGIQTKGSHDEPYWPVQSTWTYKEIWVHPVTGWIWLLRDIGGPALLEGEAGPSLICTDLQTGQQINIQPDEKGRFSQYLPQGRYRITDGRGLEKYVSLVPGSTNQVDCRTEHWTDLRLTSTRGQGPEWTIRLELKGAGSHSFELRTDNLYVRRTLKKLSLSAGRKRVLEWKVRALRPQESWVAVVVTDGDINQRLEIRGAAWEK